MRRPIKEVLLNLHPLQLSDLICCGLGYFAVFIDGVGKQHGVYSNTALPELYNLSVSPSVIYVLQWRTLRSLHTEDMQFLPKSGNLYFDWPTSSHTVHFPFIFSRLEPSFHLSSPSCVKKTLIFVKKLHSRPLL